MDIRTSAIIRKEVAVIKFLSRINIYAYSYAKDRTVTIYKDSCCSGSASLQLSVGPLCGMLRMEMGKTVNLPPVP